MPTGGSYAREISGTSCACLPAAGRLSQKVEQDQFTWLEETKRPGVNWAREGTSKRWSPAGDPRFSDSKPRPCRPSGTGPNSLEMRCGEAFKTSADASTCVACGGDDARELPDRHADLGQRLDWMRWPRRGQNWVYGGGIAWTGRTACPSTYRRWQGRQLRAVVRAVTKSSSRAAVRFPKEQESHLSTRITFGGARWGAVR